MWHGGIRRYHAGGYLFFRSKGITGELSRQAETLFRHAFVRSLYF